MAVKLVQTLIEHFMWGGGGVPRVTERDSNEDKMLHAGVERGQNGGSLRKRFQRRSNALRGGRGVTPKVTQTLVKRFM